MSNIFKWTKDLFTGSNEENYEALSHEELLKKASEVDYENKTMKEKIDKLDQQNSLLTNSIINKNNPKKSEYTNFLNLMEKNLLNSKKADLSKNYSIDAFKKFLYKEKLFFGTIEEDNINYLSKSEKEKEDELDWEKEKENNLLKQELLEINLKALYSNMFVVKDNRPNKIFKKESSGEKNENKKIFKENRYMNPYNDYIGKKRDNQVNMLEEFLLNEENEN